MSTHASRGSFRSRRRLAAFAACACIAATGTTLADMPREISWEDLLPESLIAVENQARDLQTVISELPPEVLDEFDRVGRERSLRMGLESGSRTEAGLLPSDVELLAERPSEKYPEAASLWQQIDDVRAKLEREYQMVEPSLDGQRVRIPGYALPLEFDGTKVRNFLLVPYVGACIHTPPPPPNQIVYVASERPFESEGLFEPVWVEGTLSTASGTHDLSFVDGQAPVDAGYSLKATKVEPYE